MMTYTERVRALDQMRQVSSGFYAAAVRIGNHPFIEFAGLMNEYIKACSDAHEKGIDFSDCSVHSGMDLPLKAHHLAYLNEKLECIYGARVLLLSDAATE